MTTGSTGGTWNNWAGTVRCQYRALHRPDSEDGILSIVNSLPPGERLKVVGAGHSCSSIADSSDGHLLSLKAYNRVLGLDRDKLEITVQAGITLREIAAYLSEHGLALPNLGSISDQTVAGAISTGTHGTGTKWGTLPQQVTRLTIITAAGAVLAASMNEHPDLFAAARVGLGSLGVLSTLTISCVPACNLRAGSGQVDWRTALQSYNTWNEADHASFWWIPHTDTVRTWTAERTQDLPTPARSRWRAWYDDHLWGNHLHECALLGTKVVPFLIPGVNRFFQRRLFNRRTERVDRSDRVFNFPIRIKQWVMEYAIDMEKTRKVLERLRELIEREGFRVHMPVEVRFSQPDDAWLGMAYGRPTCYIGVIMYRPFNRTVPFESYFRAVDALMADAGGRPHWAKVHYRGPDDFRQMYPRWDDFLALRKELDPAGVFLNRYLESIFHGREKR